MPLSAAETRRISIPPIPLRRPRPSPLRALSAPHVRTTLSQPHSVPRASGRPVDTLNRLSSSFLGRGYLRLVHDLVHEGPWKRQLSGSTEILERACAKRSNVSRIRLSARRLAADNSTGRLSSTGVDSRVSAQCVAELLVRMGPEWKGCYSILTNATRNGATDLVTITQPHSAASANPGRRSGDDHSAGRECCTLAQVRDESRDIISHEITFETPQNHIPGLNSLGDGPNHVARATILDDLSVQPSLEHEVAWVRQECGRYEAGAEREEFIEA